MPIVFVHGVNNRAGKEYSDNEGGRNGFLREIVAPSLGLSSKALTIESPYWGGNGAKFAWDMAVLPDTEDEYEKFGAEDDDPIAFAQTLELLCESSIADVGVADLARRDFGGTIDLVYGAALAGAKSEAQAVEVAQSYLAAVAYTERDAHPEWLAKANDDNFADLLNHYVHNSDGESFGSGGLFDMLKEGVSRLVHAVPAAASGLIPRKKLNATVTRFTGDVFVYLTTRGSPGRQGKIVDIVLEGIDKAIAAKTAQDAKLVIIAHSFGGAIMYDILTRFRPDLDIDWFITVGSQVGLFEEMKVYLASDENIPQHYPDGRVPMPSGVKHWLNVFDLNDVLSYRCRPIFEGAEDFEYDTGSSTLQAHGGYFLRPSFYTRLAARLREST